MSSYPQHPTLKPRERRHDPVGRTHPSPHRDRVHRLVSRMDDDHAGSRRWFEHAMGATAAADPAVDRRSSGEDHGGDHHHRHRPDARLRRHVRRLPPPRPDRARPLDRVCSKFVLPVVLLVRRWSSGLMSEIRDPIPGFEAPVHRALTEPILLGGAPRAVAITNGTLAALERQAGVDPEGYAGLEDQVDYHWDRLFMAAALSTLLGVGSELGASNTDSDIVRALRRGSADSLNQTGQQIVRRNLNVQPTLTIRP